MKKLLYLLLLLTTSFILVSCDTELKTHTIKVYDGDKLINNYFVDNGKPFEETELVGLINTENFDYWSTTKDGVKYTFTLPITSDLELYAIYKDDLPIPPKDITKFRITLILDSKNVTLDVEKNSILTLQMVNDKYIGNKEINYWSTSKNGSKITFPLTVSADLTLYAIFKSIPIPDPDPSPTPEPNPNPYPPTDLSSYYKSADGMAGDSLKGQLNKIIGTAKATSYDRVKEVLVKADLVFGSTNKLYLIYDSKETHNKWDSAKTWNREHVWPQSKLNGAPKGESHNLRASDVKTNSNRGNDPFAEGSGQYGKRVSGGYFPGDEHKGDVARIVMYMVTRYPQLNFGSAIGPKSLFLKWHLEDPVNDFERQRNDVIHEMQGNRNPFIDHPEFAQMIWGSNSKNTSVLDELASNTIIISTEILYYEEKRNYFI